MSGTDPNWKENLLAALEARQVKQSGRGPELSHIAWRRSGNLLQFVCGGEFIHFIDDAARTMGVNRASFCRRAIAVQVAKILDKNIHEIIWYTPEPSEYRSGGARAIGSRDLGDGITAWCPHPGCSGAHLLL